MVDYLNQWLSGKSICLQCRSCHFDPCVGKIPWRRKWQPTPVFFLEKSHGQRSLAGYRPWGCKESDMTEQLRMAGGLVGWWVRSHIAKDVGLIPGQEAKTLPCPRATKVTRHN